MANLCMSIKCCHYQLPNMKWVRALHCTDDDDGNSIGEWKTCTFYCQTYQFTLQRVDGFSESSCVRARARDRPSTNELRMKPIALRFVRYGAMCPFQLTNESARLRPAILILPINEIYVILILFDCCFPRV